MGMAEIRDAFEAYASGELAEYELRSALRAEIQTQPGAVARYTAMAAALRRRKLISAELEAVVISDMNAVVAGTSVPQATAPPHIPPTQAQTPTRASTAARSSPMPSRTTRSPGAPIASPPLDVASPAVPTGAKGAAWDAKERLVEPEAPGRVGLVLRERFGLGGGTGPRG